MFLISVAPLSVDLIMKMITAMKSIAIPTIFTTFDYASGHYWHSKEADLE
jgi:hypothetical protein